MKNCTIYLVLPMGSAHLPAKSIVRNTKICYNILNMCLNSAEKEGAAGSI